MQLWREVSWRREKRQEAQVSSASVCQARREAFLHQDLLAVAGFEREGAPATLPNFARPGQISSMKSNMASRLQQIRLAPGQMLRVRSMPGARGRWMSRACSARRIWLEGG
jgi:hypothetical protein